jgi:hypothetical protein
MLALLGVDLLCFKFISTCFLIPFMIRPWLDAGVFMGMGLTIRNITYYHLRERNF